MRKNPKTKAFILGLGLAIVLTGLIIIPAASVPGLVSQARAASDSSVPPPCNQCGEGQICLNVWINTWCVTNLAEYISIFYRYFIGIIGIFAVAMIMFGGFKWITASGNSEKINQAKDNITSAIIGVVIALFSYVLLQTINPMITSLKSDISGITGIEGAYSQICQNLYGAGWQAKVGKGADFNAECGDELDIIDAAGNPTGVKCYGGHCAEGQICGFSVMSGYKCGTPKKLCEDTDKTKCRQTDSIIKASQAEGAIDYGCAKRIDNTWSITGLYAAEGADECVYNPVIKKEQWEAAGYERVNCGESEAKNRCWYMPGNAKMPACKTVGVNIPLIGYLQIDARMRCCTDSERPIVGANTVCVRKVGLPPNDPESYTLWEP
ncbi:MAG: pilin [Patescibacteria group bacterium]|nr:pilin [Patescibacteria group bacterium]